MPRQDAKASDRTLHVKAGEKIKFPVSAKHPLAKFQTITPARSAKDLYEFLVHWARFAQANNQPPPTPATVVKSLIKAKVSILRLSADTLRIAKGAVLTLNNPLNRLEANAVELEGDLVSQGDLILTCKTLTIK